MDRHVSVNTAAEMTNTRWANVTATFLQQFRHIQIMCHASDFLTTDPNRFNQRWDIWDEAKVVLFCVHLI